MNTFKPELCVNRKSKPEHYNIKDVIKFARAAGFPAEYMKLGKVVLCDKLKAKYRNAGQPNRNAGQPGQPNRNAGQPGQPNRNAGQPGQPNRNANRNAGQPGQPNRNAGQPNRNAGRPNRNAGAGLFCSQTSFVRKGKNRNKLLANRFPLNRNVRKNPTVFKRNVKACIKERTALKHQKTIVQKILNKNIKHHYKDSRSQLTNANKNPLSDRYLNKTLKDAILLHFGELNSKNISKLRLTLALNSQNRMPITFMKYIFKYQNYKEHSNTVIQTVKVPKTWKPPFGKSELNIKIPRDLNFLNCSINSRDKLTLDKLVYIDIEVINDKIHYLYNKTTLIAHMNKKGYCPNHKWRQLRPENIKTLHPTVLDNADPDIQGLLKIRELQKIHSINILVTIEQMLSEVHTISNKHKVIRGNCGLSVMVLYDLIQQQNYKADQVEILTELGENLPVCIEAKCNFIREFVKGYEL